MGRAPSEEPEGIVSRPELLPADEEAELLRVFETLRFDTIVLHGQAAKRTGRHYGLEYDYESRTPRPGELAEILVQHYPPGATIGWHRDAPAFDTVVGISFGGSSRMRFQRRKRDERRVWEIPLEPRSGYALSDEARRSWEHSIPATEERRYSITFRTLRNRR